MEIYICVYIVLHSNWRSVSLLIKIKNQFVSLFQTVNKNSPKRIMLILMKH